MAERHLGVPLGPQRLGGGSAAGTARRVEHRGSTAIGLVDEREQVAPHAAEVRARDRHGRVRGDRGVHRIAASGKDRHAGLCRELIGRTDHRPRRPDGGERREQGHVATVRPHRRPGRWAIGYNGAMRRTTTAQYGVTIGAAAVLVGTFMPWWRSGTRGRTSYQLLGLVDRLEFAPDGPAATAVRWWPIVPFLLVGAVIAAWWDRWFIASVTAALGGGYAARVRARDPGRTGPCVGGHARDDRRCGRAARRRRIGRMAGGIMTDGNAADGIVSGAGVSGGGMTPEALDELRAVVGEQHVIVDPDVTASYARDWTGRYQGEASVVVRPRSTAEVAGVVRRCHDHRIAIVPQGGNTGLVGGAVPDAGQIVLSTQRLAAIRAIDLDAGQATVEAGVPLAALGAALQATGWEFGVDLGARDTATIGGMVATNAGGIRVLRYGSMRANVVGLEAVLGDGSVVSRLGGLLKDNTGYDLAGLLCGSEGTLGIITAARLRLVPAWPDRLTVWVRCDSWHDAQALAATVRREIEGIDGLEAVDAAGLALAQEVLGIDDPLGPHEPLGSRGAGCRRADRRMGRSRCARRPSCRARR